MKRTRIAPSPTGFPHIGTVFQAVIDYAIAKNDKGSFVVRIEDTDQSRKVDGAEEAIFESFEWIGIRPDESPAHGGDYGPYRQSERLEIYSKYAKQLIDQGDAYYCFCSAERLDETRKEMQKKGIPPMYDKHCRSMDMQEAEKKASSEPHVIRMKIPEKRTIKFIDEIRGEISFESKNVDDQVIVKSDGFPTYHLAVVIDDHLMEITDMVRGEEWITSTPKQVLLYEYFDWDQPRYIHTPLLRNPDKSKLSKRHGHASVGWYQEKGYLPEAVVNFMATRVWNHPDKKEVFTLDELVKHFDVKDMNIQGPIADLDKLNWYNGLYIRDLDEADLLERIKPFASKELLPEKLAGILPHIKERLVVLSDVNDLTDFLYAYEKPPEKEVIKKSDAPTVVKQLEITNDALESITDWTIENVESTLRSLQEDNDWHRGQYFMMLRWVTTGKKATPPLFETIHVIGKEDAINRMRDFIKILA